MDRSSQYLNKNILVVGGTGFLGFHISSLLSSYGANVYSLSKSPPVKSRKLANVTYIFHDLLIPFPDSHFIRTFDFHYIFNCAGYVDHSSFFKGGVSVLRNSFDSVLNLIQSLNWHSIKSFIQLGSSDEYGDLPSPQSESSIPTPLTSYSLSKFTITNLLLSLYASDNLPFIVVRPFLIYGPFQDSNRLFPYVISNCLSDSTFSVTSGVQHRDFLYVDDFVDAVTSLALAQHALGYIFNVGSGNHISVRDSVLLIRSLIGSGRPEFGRTHLRETENSSLYADLSRISQFIQWKPRINLVDGLNLTINYYRTISD